MQTANKIFLLTFALLKSTKILHCCEVYLSFSLKKPTNNGKTLEHISPHNLSTLIQSQKTQGFCVADFATLSDERRSRSKIFLLFIWIKEPCVRKFEGLARSKLLGISQTVIDLQSTYLSSRRWNNNFVRNTDCNILLNTILLQSFL